MRAEQLTGVATEHGEGPVWSPRWGLRFVDMLAGDVCQLTENGELRRHHVGHVAAMLRPRSGPGHVVAGEHGLMVSDADELDAALRDYGPWLEPDRAVRLNEGGCDPSGALLIGSMRYDEGLGGGRLHRVTASGDVSTVFDAVTISNGIDWSPDGQQGYYVDSATHRIDRFSWSPEVGVSDRRAWLTVPGPGVPDGLCVDADGNVWVALFGGGQVHCYTPGGRLVEVVEVGAAQVTAAILGGPDLDELFVTTSRYGRGTAAEPGAGAVFHLRLGVHGQPVRSFVG